MAPQQNQQRQAETEKVAEAIVAHAPDWPLDARQMLAAALPHAVRLPESGESLHAYQVELVTTIRTLFEDAQRRVSESQGSACARREAEEAEVAAREMSVTKAAEEEHQLSASADAKQASLQQAERATSDLAQEYADATQVHERVAADKRKLQQHSCEAGSVTEKMQMLVDGSWSTDGDRDSAAEAVGAFLEALGAEKVLVAAAAPALCTGPDNRAEFDKVIIDGVIEAVKARLAELDSALTAASLLDEEEGAVALGLWALRDATTDEEVEAKRELASARAALRAGTTARFEALEKVEEQRVVLGKWFGQQALEQKNATELTDAIATLAKLATAAEEEPPSKRARTDATPTKDGTAVPPNQAGALIHAAGA